MPWLTAIDEVRNQISDGPTDKLAWQKNVLGVLNGVNTQFKTFEKRRVTDLESVDAPLGVYLNGAPAGVADDNPEIGVFTLTDAPAEGSILVASYYHQWFDDAALGIFLKSASFFLGLGADYTQIPEGLQPAALKYACADAYQELAIRFARWLSETFRAEDLPKEVTKQTVDSYRELANMIRKDAMSLRQGYYTRQDQPYAPLFGTVVGHQRGVEPNS